MWVKSGLNYELQCKLKRVWATVWVTKSVILKLRGLRKSVSYKQCGLQSQLQKVWLKTVSYKECGLNIVWVTNIVRHTLYFLVIVLRQLIIIIITLCRLKLFLIIYKNAVPTAQRTNPSSAMKTNSLIFSEIIRVDRPES